MIVGDDQRLATRGEATLNGQPVRRCRSAEAVRRLGPRDGGPERGEAPVRGGLERLAAARALGVGEQHDGQPATAAPTAPGPIRRASRTAAASISSSRSGASASPATTAATRRGSVQPAACAATRTLSSAAGGSCTSSARGRGGGAGTRPPPPTAPPRSRRRSRPRSRRCRRRSPRRGRRAGRGRSRPRARLDEAAPGDARADAVGGQQRVERAARAVLAGAEPDVGLPRAARSGGSPASTSTKRLSATSTPNRTTWPNRPSIAPE